MPCTFYSKLTKNSISRWEGFGEETLALLQNYEWPGNLRELKNIVKRSVLLTTGELIEKTALPGEILSYDREHRPTSSQRHDTTDLKQLESSLERQKIIEALEKVRHN
ncbi:MAG: hypothetical protein U5L96_21505 [Owenweeksia sp.]|nr:hypothetical protein [Owenweeksia sp.]